MFVNLDGADNTVVKTKMNVMQSVTLALVSFEILDPLEAATTLKRATRRLVLFSLFNDQ